jgi:hypothetical protein
MTETMVIYDENPGHYDGNHVIMTESLVLMTETLVIMTETLVIPAVSSRGLLTAAFSPTR